MEEFYDIYDVFSYDTPSNNVFCPKKNGKKHGLEEGYYKNGTPSKKISFKEGMINGLAR